MNNLLKNTTLAFFTLSLAACGLYVKTTDVSSTTDDTDTDTGTGMDSPTGNEDMHPVHFTCYNSSNYQVNAAGQQVSFPLMHTCVEIQGEDWMSPENMTKILDACSASCQKTFGGWKNHCENDGWKSVEPSDTVCNPDDYTPEYGGEVLWLDGVQSFDRQVKCDLRTTCGGLFGEKIAEMLQGKVVPPDERPASGAEHQSDLQIRVVYGEGDPLDMAGTLEYSTIRCGETACPLYLGDVELLQSSDEWRMALDMGELGRIDKRISNVRVRLAKPALGISLTDGQVAFPADTLTLHVDVEVAGVEHPLVENGIQSFWVRNPTAVLGRLDNGSLDLQMEVATLFGSVRLTTTRDE